MIDETIQKEIGAFIWGIILAFGFVLFELLRLLGLSPVVIFFIEYIWFASDVLIAAIMWHYFKTKKKDVLPVPSEGRPVLTPVADPNLSEIPNPTTPEAIPE